MHILLVLDSSCLTTVECGCSESFASIESVKAVGSVYAPVDGTVTELNSDVEDEPSLANTDPEGEGWLIKMSVRCLLLLLLWPF